MPRLEYDSATHVPGLYAALLAREREHAASWDAHVADSGYRRIHGPSRRLLDALEAGHPAVLQGRRLKGWGLPKVPLRRDQAMLWFAVLVDDTVVPAESPEDD